MRAIKAIKRYKKKITEEIIEEEIQGDFIDLKLPKKHFLNNGDWIVVFQKCLLQLVSKDLSKGEYKMLIYFIAQAEISNWCYASLKGLQEALKEKSKGNISTWLKRLESINILIREEYVVPDVKEKQWRIRLNYDLAYKGKFKDFKKLQYKDAPILEAPKGYNQLPIFNDLKPIHEQKQDKKKE